MLVDKIYQDYVSALKAQDKPTANFLSFIRAGLQNKAIDLKVDKLDDKEALAVLKKQQKRLQDTKESIAQSDRQDLIAATEKELTIISQYLPKPLDQEELVKIIEAVISETGAASRKEMGGVMKEVLARVGAQADSKQVSEIVKSKLS